MRMMRSKRGTDEYRGVEQESRAAAQTAAAISKTHLAADSAIVNTEQAKAMAKQRADTLERNAARLVAADFRLATTEDARTAQYQAAFEEMLKQMEESEAACPEFARLAQASPEYREARAAQKELDQADPGRRGAVEAQRKVLGGVAQAIDRSKLSKSLLQPPARSV